MTFPREFSCEICGHTWRSGEVACERWDIPTRWGLTDVSIRTLLMITDTPDPGGRLQGGIESLLTEASYCSAVTALQNARQELALAGADSQWLEVIEALIHRRRLLSVGVVQ